MTGVRRVFDHFVVAGLGPRPYEELRPGAAECGYRDAAPLAPVTDICVIFPGLGESPPDGFTMIEKTPFGHPADLNHGSLRTQPAFLCLRRGHHKPPLVDIGVLHEGKGERVMVDSQILQTTPFGRPANVNNSSQAIYLSYRRAPENAPPNLLAVTDICVILTNKGETAPHTFCKVPKNLNKGMVGSDVFLCYKKSHAATKRIAYKPSILAQFPPEGTPGHPDLPPNVDIFCLPMGAVVECWPIKCAHPVRTYSTFILTNEHGRKFYGVAVTFYEKYEEEMTAEQLGALGLDPELDAPPQGSCSDNSSTNDPAEQMSFLTNKAICLVSRYPFFTAFKRFLFFLHRMASSGLSYAIPLERYISYLLYEVPFPSPRRPRVLMNLLNETISFDNPDDTPLPLSGACFFDFLRYLGAENGMYVLLLALMEKPILVHSLQPFLLTSVAEAVTSLIFPFHWQCPYIPQCPLDLAGVLHAPMSFICGVDSRYFELYDDPPKDVTCIDLDTNTISLSETRRTLKLSCLPRRPAKILRASLDKLVTRVHQEKWSVTTLRNSADFTPLEIDYQLQKRRRLIELEIQDAFLRFMASLMQGYKECLRPMAGAPRAGATDLSALFDLSAFLTSRPAAVGGGPDFWRPFCATQGFTRFVEERSLLSDQNAFLAFFDDCIEKVSHPANAAAPDIRLLEFESALNSNHTLVRRVLGSVAEEPATVQSHFRLCEEPEPWLRQLLEALPSFTRSERRRLHEHVFMDPVPAKAGDGEQHSYSGFPTVLRSDFFELEAVRKRSERLSHAAAAAAAASPAIFRHKQELRYAQRRAKAEASSPLRWAKCLLSYAYSLWFLHLPGLVDDADDALAALRLAFTVLERVHKGRLPVLDEVPYRILMHLCCLHEKPLLTVKVYMAMKEAKHQPNAITYGFYNRAVLEASWVRANEETAIRRWTAIRHSLLAISILRGHQKEAERRRRGDSDSVSTTTTDEPLVTITDMGPVSDLGYASSLPEDEANSAATLRGQEDSSATLVSQGADDDDDDPCSFRIGNTDMDQLLRPSSRVSRTSLTPTRLLATPVMDDPLGASQTEEAPDGASTAADSALNSSICSSSSASLFRLEERPFEADEFNEHREEKGLGTSIGVAGKKLGSWVSRGMGWNAGPSSKLARSRTLGEVAVGGEGTSDGSSQGSGEAHPVLTSSPSLSGLMAQATQSRLWKGVGDAIVAQGPTIRRYGGAAKSFVSPVVKNLKEVSLEGLSTPLRNSYSAINLEATGGGPLSDKYYELSFGGSTDQDNVSLGGEELSPEKWHRPITATEDIASIIPPTDPAFHLSSGESAPLSSAEAANLDSPGPYRLLEIVLCSATRCPKCSQLLYDEEIMAGWSADECNLNTHCHYCAGNILPLLSVRLEKKVVDPGCVGVDDVFRDSWYAGRRREQTERSGSALGSSESLNSLPGSPQRRLLVASTFLGGSTHSLPREKADRLNRRLDFEPREEDDEVEVVPEEPTRLRRPLKDNLESVKYLNVPFLSPLVLRREMETILSSEGDGVLSSADFRDAHPILFWNLLYFFQRLGLPSHITNFLHIAAFWPGEEEPTPEKLLVRCALDSPHLHTKQFPQPLYQSVGAEIAADSGLVAALLLERKTTAKALPLTIAEHLSAQNLYKPIQLLINEHRRRAPVQASPSRQLPPHFSIYRDVELLGLASSGLRWDVRGWVEAEFAGAVARLPPSVGGILPPTDAPPSLPALAARRVFRPLDAF